MKLIRKADGTIAEVEDDADGIAKDGEVVRVRMTMMDSGDAIQHAVADAAAMDELQRVADEAAQAFGDALREWRDQPHIREHDEMIRNAWRNPPTAPRVEQHADHRPSPAAIANPTDAEIAAGQARVAAAYDEADEELRNAWRT